jgi:hypothetical protein
MVYSAVMSDRVFFSLAAAAAVLMVALALVYPQGIGKRSPKPFGHETYYSVLARDEAAASAAKARAKAAQDAARAAPPSLRGPL